MKNNYHIILRKDGLEEECFYQYSGNFGFFQTVWLLLITHSRTKRYERKEKYLYRNFASFFIIINLSKESCEIVINYFTKQVHTSYSLKKEKNFLYTGKNIFLLTRLYKDIKIDILYYYFWGWGLVFYISKACIYLIGRRLKYLFRVNVINASYSSLF